MANPIEAADGKENQGSGRVQRPDLLGDRRLETGSAAEKFQPIGLVEQVLRKLEDEIVTGQLERGSIHQVGAVAQRLGVSRTPVREALLQLEKRDMVRFEANRGFRIVEPNALDIKHVFEIRLLLEPPATWKAVHLNPPDLTRRLQDDFDLMLRAAQSNDEKLFWRLDRSFHLIILQASGNRRLANFVDSLRDLMLLRQATLDALKGRRFADLAKEHRPILEGIKARDADAAAEAMYYHVEHTANVVLDYESEQANRSRTPRARD